VGGNGRRGNRDCHPSDILNTPPMILLLCYDTMMILRDTPQEKNDKN